MSWITGDREQVQQVLIDLVMNAADALPSGGVVSINAKVERVEHPLVHRHGVVAPGSYVVLSVADHGVGMTDTVLAQIFDPFYTTKPQGQDIGLRMSVVFGIVEQVRSAVVVESEVGRGSTLNAYWPQLPRERPPDEGTRITMTPVIGMRPVLASASAPPGRSDARVLLVDDDPAVSRLIMRLLERYGYVALTAGSGAKGVAVGAAKKDCAWRHSFGYLHAGNRRLGDGRPLVRARH